MYSEISDEEFEPFYGAPHTHSLTERHHATTCCSRWSLIEKEFIVEGFKSRMMRHDQYDHGQGLGMRATMLKFQLHSVLYNTLNNFTWQLT